MKFIEKKTEHNKKKRKRQMTRAKMPTLNLIFGYHSRLLTITLYVYKSSHFRNIT